LKRDTAAGFDGMAAAFIKGAFVRTGPRPQDREHVIAPMLGNLFHRLLQQGIAPKDWKMARLSPLYKKDCPADPANYRMLAVNSVLYRVYANVVRELYTDWCIANRGFVPDNQFAFYPGRNAQQPMFIMRHLFHATRGKCLHAAFIDFKQAYDTIDRVKLWEHLTKIGIPAPLLQAAKALYEGDSYVLVDGDKRTEPIRPTHGVKQGCPLSPLLFSLYINDINTVFQQVGVREAAGQAREHVVSVGDSTGVLAHISHFLYADDLVLLSLSPRHLQAVLDALAVYADAKGLTVNAGKSKVMLFRPQKLLQQLAQSGLPPQLPTFTYKGTALEQVEEFRYLGLTFNSKCNMTYAADQWAGPMMGAIRECFKQAHTLSARHMPHVLLRLFQTYAVPYGMYASQVWGTQYLRPGHAFKCSIQTRHLGFLKYVAQVKRTVASSVLLDEMCQRPFQYYWLRSVVRFWNSLLDTAPKNSLIDAVVRSELHLSRQAGCKQCWCAQLRLALREYGLEQEDRNISMLSKVGVQNCMNAWQANFLSDLSTAVGDPRDANLQGKRKLCTYNAYFRLQHHHIVGNWWQLPFYLRAGLSLSRNEVKNMARFRLSSHNLLVERGRYTNLQWQDRQCTRCAAGGILDCVDDEVHAVFECIATEGLRNANMELFEVGGQDLHSLMRVADQIRLAKFVSKVMDCVDDSLEGDGGPQAAHNAEQPQIG
jgi:sorting nexin-29